MTTFSRTATGFNELAQALDGIESAFARLDAVVEKHPYLGVVMALDEHDATLTAYTQFPGVFRVIEAHHINVRQVKDYGA